MAHVMEETLAALTAAVRAAAPGTPQGSFRLDRFGEKGTVTSLHALRSARSWGMTPRAAAEALAAALTAAGGDFAPAAAGPGFVDLTAGEDWHRRALAAMAALPLPPEDLGWMADSAAPGYLPGYAAHRAGLLWRTLAPPEAVPSPGPMTEAERRLVRLLALAQYEPKGKNARAAAEAFLRLGGAGTVEALPEGARDTRLAQCRAAAAVLG